MTGAREVTLAWLYVPASRPDRFAKAAAAADGVVIDLEDAVAPGQRHRARETLAESLGEGLGAPTVVRINAAGSADFEADVAAVTPLVRGGIVSAVRVAKINNAADAECAAHATAEWGIDRRLICQLETARAVRDADEIAAVRGVHSIMLGEADLRADLGLPPGAASDAGLSYARQKVVLAACAAGLPPPVASAYVHVADAEGLAVDCARQRALGFLGRSCIHPSQVAVVREAFRPRSADVAWARSVLARDTATDTAKSGVATLADGSFIDAPIIRQAERILTVWEGVGAHE